MDMQRMRRHFSPKIRKNATRKNAASMDTMLAAFFRVLLFLCLNSLLVLGNDFLLDVGRNLFILVKLHFEGAAALSD